MNNATADSVNTKPPTTKPNWFVVASSARSMRSPMPYLPPSKPARDDADASLESSVEAPSSSSPEARVVTSKMRPLHDRSTTRARGGHARRRDKCDESCRVNRAHSPNARQRGAL